MIHPFKKQQTQDYNLERIQNNIGDTLEALAALPILQGHLITSEIDPTTGQPTDGIIFTGGQTKEVNHKLGRPYVGWLLVRPRGTSDVLVRELAHADRGQDAISIKLHSTNVCTIYVWVF